MKPAILLVLMVACTVTGLSETAEILIPVRAPMPPGQETRGPASEGRVKVRTADEWQWAQVEGASEDAGLVVLSRPGQTEVLGVRVSATAAPTRMRAELLDRQVMLSEGGQGVLRYNYQTVEPGDRLEKIAEENRKYARPRNDYIHPLWGLSGEVLTRDWSVDHPHHRGIYWAWPEVDYGSKRGDLHALQQVFARPTGKPQLASGPVFAQVEAENEWHWEDREPIVRERVLIRAYRREGVGRFIDLAFEFLALKDGVTVARRGTELYGGLSIRLETPPGQRIVTHTDAPGAGARRAWSDLSAKFQGDAFSGLTVLQHARNPDYPGDWVQYPEISWCQPAFPSVGRRYPVSRTEPLVLRDRFWVHEGGAPDAGFAGKLWDSYHEAASAVPEFRLNAGG